MGKFQGLEYLAEKQGEQNRFSMMLAKVKGVQWCSNAAKLHYNELSFSSRENRRKHDFREDQKNSFTVIVSLKGQKVAEITTDTGNNLLFRTSFKHLAKQDLWPNVVLL